MIEEDFYMDLNYNSDQFEIGEAVVSSIKSSIDTNNSSIKIDLSASPS